MAQLSTETDSPILKLKPLSQKFEQLSSHIWKLKSSTSTPTEEAPPSEEQLRLVSEGGKLLGRIADRRQFKLALAGISGLI